MPLDDANLHQLIEAHSGFVRSVALRFAPAPGLAEDIAQQVFLEFIAKAGSWDLSADPKGLLTAMTRNVALRCWRDKTRDLSDHLRELAEHIRELAEPEEVSWYGEEERSALQRCLQKLPEKSRRLVELHYYLGVTSVDIAGQLAMNADAVRRSLFRLREKLRHCIQSLVTHPTP